MDTEVPSNIAISNSEYVIKIVPSLFPPLLFIVGLLLWGFFFNVKAERKEDEKQQKSLFIANPTVGRGADKRAP